ncbi:unnamed protein product [Linum tenue]|uniref:Kinesin motor domain-containing protein n=1 Tax=Linum tenue TaxID=586396 RepID=A0AAV0LNG8_9ROSI|nr:unnamed protein product [Linum tenue]
MVRPIVGDFLKGRNGMLAAVGPSGSGKTHTVFGTPTLQGPREPGMVPLALQYIFKQSKGKDHKFSRVESGLHSTVKGVQEARITAHAVLVSNALEAESLIACAMLKRATSMTNTNSRCREREENRESGGAEIARKQFHQQHVYGLRLMPQSITGAPEESQETVTEAFSELFDEDPSGFVSNKRPIQSLARIGQQKRMKPSAVDVQTEEPKTNGDDNILLQEARTEVPEASIMDKSDSESFKRERNDIIVQNFAKDLKQYKEKLLILSDPEPMPPHSSKSSESISEQIQQDTEQLAPMNAANCSQSISSHQESSINEVHDQDAAEDQMLTTSGDLRCVKAECLDLEQDLVKAQPVVVPGEDPLDLHPSLTHLFRGNFEPINFCSSRC